MYRIYKVSSLLRTSLSDVLSGRDISTLSLIATDSLFVSVVLSGVCAKQMVWLACSAPQIIPFSKQSLQRLFYALLDKLDHQQKLMTAKREPGCYVIATNQWRHINNSRKLAS